MYNKNTLDMSKSLSGNNESGNSDPLGANDRKESQADLDNFLESVSESHSDEEEILNYAKKSNSNLEPLWPVDSSNLSPQSSNDSNNYLVFDKPHDTANEPQKQKQPRVKRFAKKFNKNRSSKKKSSFKQKESPKLSSSSGSSKGHSRYDKKPWHK